MRVPYYGNSQINQSFGVGSTIHYYDSNSWSLNKEDLPDPATFNPIKSYTGWELDRFADAILWQEIEKGKKNFEDPVILMFEHLKERYRREVYTVRGIPDETVTHDLSPDGQTMYWRTHPKGRKVTTAEQQKKNSASFYR